MTVYERSSSAWRIQTTILLASGELRSEAGRDENHGTEIVEIVFVLPAFLVLFEVEGEEPDPVPSAKSRTPFSAAAERAPPWTGIEQTLHGRLV
ncbi:MAG: hypothetical protein GWN84_24595 [Gammaproteobacteria bacterium]|nr:hypothetical protein [Gammaproteobacteria bacterium]NIR85765.1 hypothetical protein [Gammaproteobacteria bacterium]NIR90298.1 hypothetical protein [Gammaproteobacteria bacterium]NIU06899.1 hypothetical protein [Gammaproteobacteria bacterium]NIV53832.1 hypothetical protein [Gammaproteobacteria bacterium]